MPTFFISTFGCRANQADSAVLREDLRRLRLEETGAHEEADVIIVNSCTVTESSDRQVRQLVRRIHRDNPAAKIIVTGCYAQRKPEELARIEGIDAVVGNTHKGAVAELLRADGLIQDGTYCGPVRILHGDIRQETTLTVAPAIDIGERTRPFLKIQDGCDAHCTYCIIPAVRGCGRSAEPADVVAQVRRLVEQGYKEVVLSGIHMGTYGWKLENKTTLSALLEKILTETAVPRLRLGSIEPMKFAPDLIECVAGSERMASHFHLPLQSGSNRILRLMKRPYRAERFAELVERIHQRIPDASIGTDVIAGFPGETDADFEATARCIEDSPVTYAHVFTYSPREGTEAVGLPDPVPEKVAQERSRRLRQWSAQRSLAFRRRFLGRSLSVLTLKDAEAMGPDAEVTALSDNYIKVKVHGDVRPNEIIRVAVFAMQDDYLIANG